MPQQFVPGPTISGACCDDRREVFDARNKQLLTRGADIKYLFFGDSITELMAVSLYCSFSEGLLINRGICGDVVKHMKLRLEADVLQLAPENLILLGGTNDLAELIAENLTYQQIIGRVYNDLVEIVTRVSQKEITVYLGTITPTNQQYCYHQKKKEIIPILNQKLREFAGNRNQVIIADYYQQLVNRAGDLPKKYTTDGLHLNPAGYQRLAAELEKKVVYQG